MPHYTGARQGTGIGFIFTSMSTFPILFIFIYNTFFANGHYTDPENQDIEDFMLFIVIGFGVVNVLGILFYFQQNVIQDSASMEEKIIKNNTLECRETDIKATRTNGCVENGEVLHNGKHKANGHIDKNGYVVNTKETIELSITNDSRELSAWAVFKSLKYQCMCWSFALVTGLAAMHINNLTTYLASFHLDEYSAILPYINPLFGTFFKPLYGAFSDKLNQKITKEWWLLCIAILMMLAFFICIFIIDQISAFVLTLLIIDMGNFIYIITVPDLLVKYFGVRIFPACWGFCFGMFSCFSFIFLVVFGIVYDSKLDPDAGLFECYGVHCFTETLVIATVACFISVLLSSYLLKDEQIFVKCRSWLKTMFYGIDNQNAYNTME